MGIRVIIASTSGEKAKYKERILDWIIAFCLLFFMHYIMAASVTVVEKINTMLGEATGVFGGINLPSEYGKVKYKEGTNNPGQVAPKPEEVYPEIASAKDVLLTKVKVNIDGSWYQLANAINMGRAICKDANEYTDTYAITDDETITFTVSYSVREMNGTRCVDGGSITTNDSNVFDVSGMADYFNSLKPTADDAISSGGGVINDGALRIEDGGDGSKILYFINYARLFLNVKDDNQYIPISIGYLIIYIALTVFTVVFTIRYIKRVIYLAFLTMVAPMVAMTYPLDKLKDRKSTGLEYVV